MRRALKTSMAVALGFALADSGFAGESVVSDTKKITLDQAAEMAMKHNPDILKAIQEIERTRGLVLEVRAQALPSATLVSRYNQEDRSLLKPRGASSGDSGSSDLDLTNLGSGMPGAPVVIVIPGSGGGEFERLDKSWRVAMDVRQVLYAGGQVRAALKIADFTRDSSYYQLLDTVEQVIYTVRQQFYDIILNRALIRVQEQALRLAEQQLKDQKNRFDAGTVPRFNVLRAEVEVSNVRPSLIRAKNDYRIAIWRLMKTLGQNTLSADSKTNPFEVFGQLGTGQPLKDLDKAIALARERRPFLKVQRLNILNATEQIKVALAGYKPRLDLVGGYEARNSSASDDIDDTVNGWFFGVEGSWAVFDGFETKGKAMQARAQLEQAKVTYDDSVRRVDLEVQEAFTNVQQGVELIESQEKNVEQANEAVRLATERFNAGAGTQLDVLDAQTALTDSETNALQARYTYYIAKADFDRATSADTKFEETFDDPLVKSTKAKSKKR